MTFFLYPEKERFRNHISKIDWLYLIVHFLGLAARKFRIRDDTYKYHFKWLWKILGQDGGVLISYANTAYITRTSEVQRHLVKIFWIALYINSQQLPGKSSQSVPPKRPLIELSFLKQNVEFIQNVHSISFPTQESLYIVQFICKTENLMKHQQLSPKIILSHIFF